MFAYATEKIRRGKATYDFLARQMNDDGRAKGNMPRRTAAKTWFSLAECLAARRLGVEVSTSGTLRYYDIIVLLWYHGFDYDIIVDVISIIS